MVAQPTAVRLEHKKRCLSISHLFTQLGVIIIPKFKRRIRNLILSGSTLNDI
ncbi:hypothetical protein HanRHA438_Chr04g0172501 [Helianthus annuus]|nr:hypothetical protein HanIR_Chr04g0175561 [Helianthus annuus]KAJ0926548.1 hypothetical protein HanRHA438_Chr04g0172501 [Helianthus annuus]